jgi:hypothetical protein
MPIEFTTRDFKEGFWYNRPSEDFPPPGLSDLDAYSGQKRLSVIGVPPTLSKNQAKLTKLWVEVLPSLNNAQMNATATRENE